MTEKARKTLEGHISSKRASLTPVEAAFLHALLIDTPTSTSDGDNDDHDKAMESASKRLSDDMLFQVVKVNDEINDDDGDDDMKRVSERPVCTRDNRTIGDMWKAFEDGVGPRRLLRVLKHNSSKKLLESSKSLGTSSKSLGIERRKSKSNKKKNKNEKIQEEDEKTAQDTGDEDSVRSDEEVRVDKSQYDEDIDDDSSWAEEEGGFVHFDAWEVLKDEYAKDFGFSYEHRSSEEEFLTDESEDDSNHFLILGTSASDKTATPHVMSPPLMDALMTFLPDVLHNQNYWLKYSLLRDGASFETFKRYIRGSQNTILALETADGHVFGSFTTSPWRTHPSFYGGGGSGGGQTFLWKMRHGRKEKCYSLLEQAQLENEIDVYVYSGENDMIQLCTHDRIAIGGGALKGDDGNKNSSNSIDEFTSTTSSTYDAYDDSPIGFGITIDDDLLHGSTSPCATYRNPCLLNHSKKDETFKIVNLEVWTLTPCVTVDMAEKLELTKFFIEDSQQHIMHTNSPSMHLTSHDLKQDEFFRRVGHNEGESAQRRDRWQRDNMMGGGGLIM